VNSIRSAVMGESASERRSLSAGDRMQSPNRRTTGQSPVIPRMVGDRMAGRPCTAIRETDGETERCSCPSRAEEPSSSESERP